MCELAPSVKPSNTDACDKAYTRDQFLENYGVTLVNLPTSARPTPDFSGTTTRGVTFVAELETLERSRSTEPQAWILLRAKDGTSGAIPKTNAQSRIASHVEDAVRQLADFKCPRVLIVINDDPWVRLGDLESLWTGIELLTDGTNRVRRWCYQSAYHKRLMSKRAEIDLLVWFDRYDNARPILRTTTDAGERLAQDLEATV